MIYTLTGLGIYNLLMSSPAEAPEFRETQMVKQELLYEGKQHPLLPYPNRL